MKSKTRYGILGIILTLISLSIPCGLTAIDNIIVKQCSLKFLSPEEVKETLVLEAVPGQGYSLNLGDEKVQLRFSLGNNRILLSGSPDAVNQALQMIEMIDEAPRQIIIEAEIVEVNNVKARELGIDWDEILEQVNAELYFEEGDGNTSQRNNSNLTQEELSNSSNTETRNSNNGVSFDNQTSVMTQIDEVTSDNKNGESFIIGGFKRTVSGKRVKRVPILGKALPFLFSQKTDQEDVRDVYIVLTPRAVESSEDVE